MLALPMFARSRDPKNLHKVLGYLGHCLAFDKLVRAYHMKNNHGIMWRSSFRLIRFSVVISIGCCTSLEVIASTSCGRHDFD